MKKEEYIEKYGIEAYQRRLESKKRWREKNADYNKQYYQEHKDAIKEYQKQHYQDNRENELEYRKHWRESHKTEKAEYNKQYKQTPMGRAANLVYSYKRKDKQHNRGECTLTTKWVLDNIFTSKCIYCGESDWKQLGCDRIDNNLPHTEDNVVCCCYKCNTERNIKDFNDFLTNKCLC